MASDLPPNRVKVFSSTTGTGASIALGARVSDMFASMAEAGGVNTRVYDYMIEQGNEWEHNSGVYTSSGSTIARGTPLQSRVGGTYGTSKINLNGSQIVYFPYFKEVLQPLAGVSAVRTRKRYYFVASDGTNWVKPTDANFTGVSVWCYGPGGGGGGSTSNNNTQGGGGGGGAMTYETIAAASLGATVALAIGTGGVAGTTTTAGSAGNKATAFGALCSAGPGLGGLVGTDATQTWKTAAAATGGTYNWAGSPGRPSSGSGGKTSTSNADGQGGGCGSDYNKFFYVPDVGGYYSEQVPGPFFAGWGAGSPNYNTGNRVGRAGHFPGGGGSGGFRSSTSQAGGAGANGWIIVEEQYGA